MARPAEVLVTVAVAVVAAGVGLIVSLFTSGVGLFADGGGPYSRFFIAGAGAVTLFVIGLLGGLLVPSRWRTFGIWLGLPTIAVVLLFAEVAGRPDWFGWLLLAAVFIVSSVAASLLGAWLGGRFRTPRRDLGREATRAAPFETGVVPPPHALPDDSPQSPPVELAEKPGVSDSRV